MAVRYLNMELRPDSSSRHQQVNEVLLANLREGQAQAAAGTAADAGFDASTAMVDLSSRAAVHRSVETAIAIVQEEFGT